MSSTSSSARSLLATLVAFAALNLGNPSVASAQAAPTPQPYRPPVAGVIVDHFRPPLRPYGPANLGIDYRTDTDAIVTASQAGVITFAGYVGDDQFVVIAHGDGLRTTYGFLASMLIGTGRAVVAGQPIGTSSGLMHFGVRRGSTYVDPERVLRGARLRTRLVPNR